jgi:hypothetical protein
LNAPPRRFNLRVRREAPPSQPWASSSSGSGVARASTIHTANGSFSGRFGAGRSTSSADSRATITPNAAGISSASPMPSRSTYQHWLLLCRYASPFVGCRRSDNKSARCTLISCATGST